MSEAEVEVKKGSKPKYYTNVEAQAIVKDVLDTQKISYLSIKVRTKFIEVIQLGEHESAGAIMSLLTLPGIYGKSETLAEVRLDKDQFGVVTRTILTLPRDGAEQMFEDDGAEEPEKATEEEPVDLDAGDPDNDEDEDEDNPPILAGSLTSITDPIGD